MRALLLALPLPAFLMLPVQAQNAPPSPEVFYGCPAGQTLETAPDPRLLMIGPMPQRPGPRLVVRCVNTTSATMPVCPSGLRLTALAGPDRCTAGSGLSGVSDGTSNTASFGEASARSSSTSATMGDGSVRMVSEGASPPATSNRSSTFQASSTPTAASVVVGGKPKGGAPAPTASSAPSQPACIIPASLLVDPAGPADLCVVRSFGQPAARVSARPPQ